MRDADHLIDSRVDLRLHAAALHGPWPVMIPVDDFSPDAITRTIVKCMAAGWTATVTPPLDVESDARELHIGWPAP